MTALTEYFNDDPYYVIQRIVEDQLIYYKSYSGEIKAIDLDGVADVHIVELGTKDEDAQTWIPCLPGIWLNSAMRPKIGQHVEIRFNGNKDRPRYYFADPAYYESSNSGLSKYVLFELGGTKITYNGITKKIEIVSDGTVEISGTIPGGMLESSILGQTLQTQLNQLKTDYAALITAFNALVTAYNAHGHASAPTGPIVGPTVPGSPGSNTTADFSLILSPNVKNN